MIGAISFKINNGIIASVYLVGSYEFICWDVPCECELGEEYRVYQYKEDISIKPSLFITKGVNGTYSIRLVETKRYILKLTSNDGKDKCLLLPHFQNEENKSFKIERDRDSITFQVVNYLGYSKIIFGNEVDSLRVPFEVVPDKMDYVEDYIELTEALAEKCSELLLEYSGSTSNIFSHNYETSKTILEQFIFLRQFCYSQSIQGLFEAIKRNPERVLKDETLLVPIGTARPSKKFYTNPLENSAGWGRTGTQMLPQSITTTKKRDNVDTPANRFVKYSLNRFAVICDELLEKTLGEDGKKYYECITEAETIKSMIEDILQDRFFDDIGTLEVMPQNNQILQKREGYSQIFSAYSMVDMALQLDWKGKDDAFEGESKNVALLYEYWLFFELFNILKSIEGCELVQGGDNSFLSVDEGLGISLEQGKKSMQSFKIEDMHTKINLYYNRTFSPAEFKTTKYEGSYSRPFRPDYTLAIYPIRYVGSKDNGEDAALKNGDISYIHFDAKYRVTDLTSFIGKKGLQAEEEELQEDKLESITNTYKRGDLLKMHTYNDAIRRTVGSYVLYPGDLKNSNKKGVSYCLYDELLPGVGAFAIKPSIRLQGETELKKFIMALIRTKDMGQSRLNRMKHYMEMVLKEPSVSKINVVEDNKDGEYVIGYIKAERKNDYFFFLQQNGKLQIGEEFIFYFYAIKEGNVYSHHKDLFSTKSFRFYTNDITEDGLYKLNPLVCKIESNELVSRENLVDLLNGMGYQTEKESHQADFYYVLSLKVVDEKEGMELSITDVNSQNGNDTYSAHSPKVLTISK